MLDILLKNEVTHIRGNCEVQVAYRHDRVFVDGVNVGAITYEWEWCGLPGDEMFEGAPHPDGNREYVGFEFSKFVGRKLVDIPTGHAVLAGTPDEREVLKMFLRAVVGLQKGTKIKIRFDRSNAKKTDDDEIDTRAI
jgi:hypothetical protein